MLQSGLLSNYIALVTRQNASTCIFTGNSMYANVSRSQFHQHFLHQRKAAFANKNFSTYYDDSIKQTRVTYGKYVKVKQNSTFLLCIITCQGFETLTWFVCLILCSRQFSLLRCYPRNLKSGQKRSNNIDLASFTKGSFFSLFSDLPFPHSTFYFQI